VRSHVIFSTSSLADHSAPVSGLMMSVAAGSDADGERNPVINGASLVHGRALGVFWETENKAKNQLPTTTAENVSIQNVS